MPRVSDLSPYPAINPRLREAFQELKNWDPPPMEDLAELFVGPYVGWTLKSISKALSLKGDKFTFRLPDFLAIPD